MVVEGDQLNPGRVLVVAGGNSGEREVSLESGRTAAAALRDAGYQVAIWDPAAEPAGDCDFSRWDIAFPMLHGAGGEDGVLHQTLQKAGLPWVGPGIEASRLTFDKAKTRERLIAHGIPVAGGQTIQSVDGPLPAVFPVVVKPARQGSSLGISVVSRAEDWFAALEKALALDSDVVVENYIEGREVSIPVIYGDVFPVVEIVLTDGWYDYQNKYVSDAAEYHVSPSGLPDELCSLAAEACDACDAVGVLRVDFRIDSQGTPYVLEINTIPGMSDHSLVPLSVTGRGWSLAQFCDWCVKSAWPRSDQG